MNASHPLIDLRRPEVKATARQGNTVWIGASSGLYRLDQGELHAVPTWAGRKIAAMSATTEGLILAAASPDGLSLHITDLDGEPVRTLPSLPDDEAKSLSAGQGVFAGGKKGIYRLDGETWTRVYGQGHTEMIGLDQTGQCVRAFAKKQGPLAQPALIVSDDGGTHWRIALETTYHDGILAERDGRYVTRWRGPWTPGQAVRHEKDAANAAVMASDRVAWIAGNKLCVRFNTGARLDIKDPRFAEAEQLQLLDTHVLIAGGNGAYLMDLRSAQVRDLFEHEAVPADAAKVKKVWALEEGRMLATTSYGTFFSDDEGTGWQVSHSDWAVLDAEGLALSPDGAWYLAAQRGLFVSWNNGASWKQVKFSTRPHFAELTALVFSGDRMLLGSKAGLFVSEPGMPKQLQPVEALNGSTVVGLLVEQAGSVIVGTADGRLQRLDPTSGQLEMLAVFQRACRPLAQREHGVDVLSAGTLYQVAPGSVTPIALPEGVRSVDAAPTPQGGLIAWSRDRGWQRPHAASDWTTLPRWPAHAKSVAVGARTTVTDRSDILWMD